MGIKKISVAVVGALAASGVVGAHSPASATAADPTGKYTTVTPSRILDTRSGTGGVPVRKLSAGGTITLQVAGRAGLPATGVQAVVVNLTAIKTAGAGYVTAYPSGIARPSTSVLNYGAGWTGATTVTVPVGSDGKIKLYAGWSSIDLAADVVGWYASSSSTATPGALYLMDDPERWYDGRNDSPFAPGDYLDMPIDFDESGGRVLKAVKVNLTALNGTGNGYFTAWNGAGTTPKTSVLNFAKGEISPNLTVVPVRRIGPSEVAGLTRYTARIQNTSGVSADLLVDAVGSYFTDPANIGTTFSSISPTRIADTRASVTGIRKGKLGPATQALITVPNSLDTSETIAYEGTITVANATTTTYLTQWRADETRPGTSNINTLAGKNRSNGFTTDVGETVAGGSTYGYRVYNSSGSVDVLEDVTGRFEVTPELIATFSGQRAKSRVGGAARFSSTSPLSVGVLVRGR